MSDRRGALRSIVDPIDRRVPLWLRLTVGVLALVSITLLGTGVSGVKLLRSSLLAKAGTDLTSASERTERALVTSARVKPRGQKPPNGRKPPAGPPRNDQPRSAPTAPGPAPAGTPTVTNPGAAPMPSPPPSRQIIQYLVDVNGTVMRDLTAQASADPAPKLPRLTDGRIDGLTGKPFITHSTGGSGRRWLVLITPAKIRPGEYLVVAEDLSHVDEPVGKLVTINLSAGTVALAALAVACFLLVRLSLRPLRTVESTARKIAAGDLSRRVPDRGTRTEIGRLGTAVNGMLARIEAAVSAQAASAATARASESQMRRFAADASHELRTPITTIRGYAEMYRQQRAAMSDQEADRIVGRIEDQARRMGMLVDDLLLLAHLDQHRPLRQDAVDLTSLVADVVLDIQTLHTAHPVDLVALRGPDTRAADRLPGTPDDGDPNGNGEIGAIEVVGDPDRLRQVVTNLVNNAIKHTPAGTAIRVGVGATRVHGAGYAVLEVTDEGPGMTPDQAARAFERFYRADPARAKVGGGAGLGLSIVSAIVVAHGGTVDLDTAPGQGTRIRVWLPTPSGIWQPNRSGS